MCNDGKVIFFHDYEDRLSGEVPVTCPSMDPENSRMLKREGGSVLSMHAPIGDGLIPVLRSYSPPAHGSALPRARADCERMQAWRASGLPVPDCAALGEGGEGRGAFLLLMLPTGSTMLDEYLARALPEEQDRALLSTAAALAGIHALGMRLPRLSASSITVGRDRAPSFLEPAWLCQQQSPDRSVFHDMAHLFATLEDGILTRSRKLRFITAHAEALGRKGEGPWIRKAWFRLGRLEKGARKKGILPSSIPVVSAGRDPERCDTNKTLQAVLAKIGFMDLSDYRDPGNRAVLLRDRGDRRNYRIEGEGLTFYLKTHSRGCEGPGASPGAREWNNHLRFMKRGIPCPTPAAWGESRGFSFFLSLGSPGLPADDPGLDWRGLEPVKRRSLVRKMARWVASMHESGLYHRDLYLCHLLVHEEAITFIDLQRVADCPFFSRHRRVKDLAALLYSAQGTALSSADRMRFFKHYRGTVRNRTRDKRLIRTIARKADRIMTHDRKHREPKRETGSTNEMVQD